MSKGAEQLFLIRGWLVGPEVTVLKLNGPWYDSGIPDDIRADPGKGPNLDQLWVRKSTPAAAPR
jgi:hypothetical protein